MFTLQGFIVFRVTDLVLLAVGMLASFTPILITVAAFVEF